MHFWFRYILILGVALWLRVWQIDLRPLHSDEGVNFHFLETILQKGYYPYSHENYHGPAFFYLTLLGTTLLGFGELGMRVGAAVCGVLLLLLLLPLRKTEGNGLVLMAALLCALSSSLVFYARYCIHESLFLFAGAGMGIAIYRWARTFESRYIYLCGLMFGILVATKETFIITVFCLGLAALAVISPFDLLREAWLCKRHVFRALLLSAVVVILLFTGGLQWMGGLRELFLGVPQWIGRNQSDYGHFKGFWYYTDMLVGADLRSKLAFWSAPEADKVLSQAGAAETQILLALIIPAAYLLSFPPGLMRAIFTPRNAIFRFSAVWALSAFLVYSFINYKTPWLVINITFPTTIFMAACLYRLFKLPRQSSWLGVICMLVATTLAAWNVWRFNWVVPYGPINPYSYVHTASGMLELLEDLRDYRRKKPHAKILIGVGSYWPLPYYLRDWKGALGYLKIKDASAYAHQYDVMILDQDVNWEAPGWRRQYYRLSDVQESYSYFKDE